jgi:hemerythrin superfamily protein
VTDMPSDPAAREDVVGLLTRQHEEIRGLFRRVEMSAGQARREAFRQLVRLLAVHETAEEMVVHPRARTAVVDGEAVVEARLREEREAKEVLSKLDDLDPDAPEFGPMLSSLQDMVLRHAEQEEREEFPGLRVGANSDELRGMATAVRAVEATAPTRPHPGIESARANLLTGPVMSVFDRARDALRSAMAKGDG